MRFFCSGTLRRWNGPMTDANWLTPLVKLYANRNGPECFIQFISVYRQTNHPLSVQSLDQLCRPHGHQWSLPK